MNRSVLTVFFTAALVFQGVGQVAPYSRADELRRIEDELRRVDSSSVVVPSDFRERLRMRLQVQADQNYLRAQKSAGAEAPPLAGGFSQRIHRCARACQFAAPGLFETE